MNIKTISEVSRFKDLSKIIIPQASADIAAEVVIKSICEPLENLVGFLDKNSHLNKEGLLEKAQNLKYRIKKGEDITSLVDEMYYSLCLADINHRYGKENSEAKQMMNNLNYLLKELRA